MLRHIAAFAVLLAAPLAETTNAPADLTPADSRKPLPEVALTDDKGTPVLLSAYKGRVVLLDFWATWCTGCKKEIPWFVRFQRKYKRSGLTVVGASLDGDGWKSVKPYLREHKINYRIAIGTFESAKPFGADKGMPVSVLIDRHGKIADVHPGMVDKVAFEREIQTLLKEPAANSAR
ncbi:MAG TPA: TlpA disulfide reductase family protein [Candidatus Acidoferrum sp.]|nr:TlpA disulfide reductase family protein [Candidatus Acidoferrum sp.]